MQQQTGHTCDSAYAAAFIVHSEVCPKFLKEASKTLEDGKAAANRLV